VVLDDEKLAKGATTVTAVVPSTVNV